MGRAVGEAIFRLDRMVDEMVELRKLLGDIEKQERGERTSPRPRPPATEPVQPGQPAPTTYGAREDRAASRDDLQLLRAVAKGKEMTETQLDEMVQRRYQKARWNMLSYRQCHDTRLAIEAGER